MIKENVYKERAQYARLDAAMLALGFKWDGTDAYVPTNEQPVQVKTAVVRKYSRSRQRRESDPAFYEGILRLEPGMTADITDEVRRLNKKPAQMTQRIYSWMYSKGKNGTHRYNVKLVGGAVLVIRK